MLFLDNDLPGNVPSPAKASRPVEPHDAWSPVRDVHLLVCSPSSCSSQKMPQRSTWKSTGPANLVADGPFSHQLLRTGQQRQVLRNVISTIERIDKDVAD